MKTMVLSRQTSHSRDEALYRGVMIFYLITSALLSPILLSIVLSDLGAFELSWESLPNWLAGYFMIVGFLMFACMVLASIPAIYLCFHFWYEWRIVIPALCLLAADASVFLFQSVQLEWIPGWVMAVYAIVAFAVGIEWLGGRIRAITG